MVNNYYTLVQVVYEIRKAFCGKTIAGLYSQERDTLTLTCSDVPKSLIIRCEAARNALLLKRTTRARKNTIDLLRPAVGATINACNIAVQSREILLSLSNELRIIIQLFGPKANVLLVDKANTIIDSFLQKNAVLHTVYTQPPLREEGVLPLPKIQRSAATEGETLLQFLKRNLPTFGTTLIHEVIDRAGFCEECTAVDLTESDEAKLNTVCENLITELLQKPSPRIYFENNAPVLFSLIPLERYKAYKAQLFDSVSDAVQTFLGFSHRFGRMEETKKLLLQKLTLLAEQTDRSLRAIAEQRAGTSLAEEYERYGKLLLASLHTISKGMSAVMVEDTFLSPSRLVEIPLDVHLTPAKNAERYFQKAQKLRRTLNECNTRERELSEKKEKLNKLREELIAVTDIQEFLQKHKEILASFGIRMSAKGRENDEERLPFRVFTVSGGFQVLAGKSSENNDLLTTRYTAKDDLWFHAHGVGGSHVVLKAHSAKGEIPRKAIEEAASIAAYYSKMKKASKVPVTMCEGKYVRKPKGVPLGTVLVEREKTLFVEPRLPSQDDMREKKVL